MSNQEQKRREIEAVLTRQVYLASALSIAWTVVGVAAFIVAKMVVTTAPAGMLQLLSLIVLLSFCCSLRWTVKLQKATAAARQLLEEDITTTDS